MILKVTLENIKGRCEKMKNGRFLINFDHHQIYRFLQIQNFKLYRDMSYSIHNCSVLHSNILGNAEKQTFYKKKNRTFSGAKVTSKSHKFFAPALV